MEILAYTMRYNHKLVEKTEIACVPMKKIYFEEYRKIYNACFYEMRESLDIEPYNFLSNFKQIEEKLSNMYILMKKEEIIGSVACYDNEIDDLIVRKEYQNKGYGRQLLLWGMQYIRERNEEPIVLHVAAWNEKAIKLYREVGFEVVKTEKIR